MKVQVTLFGAPFYCSVKKARNLYHVDFTILEVTINPNRIKGGVNDKIVAQKAVYMIESIGEERRLKRFLREYISEFGLPTEVAYWISQKFNFDKREVENSLVTEMCREFLYFNKN